MNLIQHYINGKVVPGDSKRKGKVFNPATGNQESEVLLGTKSDLNKVSSIIKKTKGSCRSFVCDVTNAEEFKNILNSTKKGSVLLFSGFYTSDVDSLEELGISNGLIPLYSSSENNWALLAMKS